MNGPNKTAFDVNNPLMEVFSFPQFPAASSLVYFTLYTNVTNSAAVRKRIIGAASAQGLSGEQEREAVNFSFIDARLVGQRCYSLNLPIPHVTWGVDN